MFKYLTLFFSFSFFSLLCSMQQMVKFLRFGGKMHEYKLVITYALVETWSTCTYVRVPKPGCG